MNEPASWKRSGESLLVRSRAKTDFWRKTFYGYVTDNGHFFYVPVSGDFVFQARVNGVRGVIRSGRTDGAAERGELDEVRNGVFRWSAACERSVHTGFFRLVHDARFV